MNVTDHWEYIIFCSASINHHRIPSHRFINFLAEVLKFTASRPKILHIMSLSLSPPPEIRCEGARNMEMINNIYYPASLTTFIMCGRTWRDCHRSSFSDEIRAVRGICLHRRTNPAKSPATDVFRFSCIHFRETSTAMLTQIWFGCLEQGTSQKWRKIQKGSHMLFHTGFRCHLHFPACWSFESTEYSSGQKNV